MSLPRFSIQNILLSAAFVLLGALVLWILVPWGKLSILVSRLSLSDSHLQRIEESTVSICYSLVEDRWVTFPMPEQSSQLRILSHADVRQSEQSEFRYALDYRVRDTSGQTLVQGRYHCLSRLVEYYDTELERFVRPKFYQDENVLPAGTTSFILNLDKLVSDGRAADVQIRWIESNEPIDSVVVRTYFQDVLKQPPPVYEWDRMRYSLRRKLTSSNVYPLDFISEIEKLNLMSRRWRPFGPSGVEGDSFLVKKLFLMKDFEGLPYETILQDGLDKLSPILARTYALQGEGLNPLTIEAHFPEGSTAEEALIEIIYFDEENETLMREQIILDKPETQLQRSYPKGLLSLEANTELRISVRPEADHLGKFSSIASTPYQPAVMLEDNWKLAYGITHVGGAPTPFRLKVRTLTEDSFGLENLIIDMSFHDVEGKTLAIRKLPIDLTPSRYDYIRRGGDAEPLSEASSFYFQLPDAVASVRFKSVHPVLITGYNRVFAQPKLTYVPEDYERDYGEAAKPTWFQFRPYEHKLHKEAGRYFNIFVQERPPLDPEMELSAWSSLYPYSETRANVIVYPLSVDHEDGKPANPINYHRLAANQTHVLDFKDRHEGGGIAQAHLLVRQQERRSGTLRVLLDGEVLVEAQLTERSAIIPLPSIQVGSHRLEVQCPLKVDLWLNRHRSDNPPWQSRLAFQIGHEPQRFRIRKTKEEESLVIRFFPKQPQEAGRVRLFAHLNAPERDHLNPQSAHTIRRRIYNLDKIRTEPVEVFSFPHEQVYTPHSCYFSLLQDLPVGDYELTFELVEGGEGYLNIIQEQGGQSVLRKIREQ